MTGPKETGHIVVLMGGWSAEREVSLVSGAACAKALEDAGYQVTTIDLQPDLRALLEGLYPRPDAVLNALHGRYGEDPGAMCRQDDRGERHAAVVHVGSRSPAAGIPAAHPGDRCGRTPEEHHDDLHAHLHSV